MNPDFSRIYADIAEYMPFNPQEAADKALMLDCLEKYDDLFERSNLLCHMTASCWTVNQSRTKVLMAYHNIYGSWAWLGGHADGDTDLMKVAIKECKEESGLETVKPLLTHIYSLEALTVNGHVKKGVYVPSHLHLNVTYLLTADENAPLRPCEGENKAVKWFTLDEALAASTEEWFKSNIYSKLNAKLLDINS